MLGKTAKENLLIRSIQGFVKDMNSVYFIRSNDDLNPKLRRRMDSIIKQAVELDKLNKE